MGDITWIYKNKSTEKEISHFVYLLENCYDIRGNGRVNVDFICEGIIRMTPIGKTQIKIGQQQYADCLEGKLIFASDSAVTFELFGQKYSINYSSKKK